MGRAGGRETTAEVILFQCFLLIANSPYILMRLSCLVVS